MAQGGFEVTNNGKTQYGYRIVVDYDEMEFTVNEGKSQKLNKGDFKIEVDKD